MSVDLPSLLKAEGMSSSDVVVVSCLLIARDDSFGCLVLLTMWGPVDRSSTRVSCSALGDAKVKVSLFAFGIQTRLSLNPTYHLPSLPSFLLLAGPRDQRKADSTTYPFPFPIHPPFHSGADFVFDRRPTLLQPIHPSLPIHSPTPLLHHVLLPLNHRPPSSSRRVLCDCHWP